MIDVADSSAVYYYHYDGLGSVVALSDSYGNSCQSYEYSAFGQVVGKFDVSDPNFIANPYLFTGRRFDYETGLYYYRARYYNPYIGRFLQTDPIGYSAGMNLYAYCKNNPLNFMDPSGLYSMSVRIPTDCITDEPNATTATYDVSDWLTDVDFFDEYEGWYVEYVTIDGAYFDISLTDGSDITDVCDVCEPTFDIVHIGGVQVVVIDGIGRLDSGDRTLNRIIQASVQSVNKWWPRLPNPLNLWRLRWRCDTPFHNFKVVNWKYNGIKFKRDEINYILEGHAMHHLRIPYEIAFHVFVGLWKEISYQESPSGGTVFWFEKGYDEYDDRKTW